MKNFADRIMNFYKTLSLPSNPGGGIEVMNPYGNNETMEACSLFYKKFYNDNRPRRIILGINPGRFGAGITGIPFTDPIQLEKACGIKNPFEKKPELSSQFVYMFINRMGGPEHFYKHYYIGAVSPLGFVKQGKNFNYYDSKSLAKSLKPFIIKTLIEQIALGTTTDVCFCLGQGKNYEYLSSLNEELGLFNRVIPLPHPRWVMQYKRKKLEHYLSLFVEKLSR